MEFILILLAVFVPVTKRPPIKPPAAKKPTLIKGGNALVLRMAAVAVIPPKTEPGKLTLVLLILTLLLILASARFLAVFS